MNRFVAWMVVAFWVPLSAVAAGAPAEIRVLQAWAELPQITLYMDVRDATGAALSDIEPDQLIVTVGGETAKAEKIEPFSATTEGVAYIFLVDISASLAKETFERVKAGLHDWFSALRPEDRAAVLTFGDRVTLVQDFTADTSLLEQAVAPLAPTDMKTALRSALVQGISMGRRQDPDLPRRRVIVTLTDGEDDALGGVTEPELKEKIHEQRIPIYPIGFATPKMQPPRRDAGFQFLGEVARRSGGFFLVAPDDDLAKHYGELRRHIGESLIAHLICAKCVADNRQYRLEATLAMASTVLPSDGLELRLVPPAAPPVQSTQPAQPLAEPVVIPALPQTEPPPLDPSILEAYGPHIAAGLLLLALVLVALLRMKRADKGKETEKERREPEMRTKAIRPLDDYERKSPAETSALPVDPGTPQATFAVIAGGQPGKRYAVPLTDDAVLGRSASCGLVIEGDEEVSNRHCRLLYEAGKLWVEDLGSTNGTQINGVAIQGSHRLSPDDRLQIGRTELRLITVEG
jgi:Mg-chelatase subunit ChlD